MGISGKSQMNSLCSRLSTDCSIYFFVVFTQFLKWESQQWLMLKLPFENKDNKKSYLFKKKFK
jgi:hypothetical protein